MLPGPEDKARKNIDQILRDAGWAVQDMDELNLKAANRVAVREFPLDTGDADYLLFADGKTPGTVEAKAEGTSLGGVSE